ncbi:ligase-associated DNA damage response exonuclease [Stenotrophomonas sp.]|uniref:ligase-associated DNA damage response exonuclease n=1 Tax=Stenotrophomonas sp. TaxID=69392 RepID=UPI0028A6C290|nr:ligase-associated DNA damage response exonuclease [Stenotrophomonas sp.]
MPATRELDDLVVLRPEGLYCPAGDFHIDPWRPVARAVITHGHGDHARSGMGFYHCSHESVSILRWRLGEVPLQAHAYGESFTLGRVQVSLHPAGHVLGSAQVRIDDGTQVWVASGDYKRQPDPTCAPFEVVRCDTFITEATFALPIYRWQDTGAVAADIVAWRQECAQRGEAAILLCYALGKAQRVLAELHPLDDQPAWLHGAIANGVAVYRQAGVRMLDTDTVAEQGRTPDAAGRLILAPPSAAGTPWLRRFGRHQLGFASGWMQLRGNRRRRNVDRGFVVSDHADWPALLQTIEQTGAQRVIATHGNTDALVPFLRERGVAAETFRTDFGNEE